MATILGRIGNVEIDQHACQTRSHRGCQPRPIAIVIERIAPRCFKPYISGHSAPKSVVLKTVGQPHQTHEDQKTVHWASVSPSTRQARGQREERKPRQKRDRRKPVDQLSRQQGERDQW